MKDNPGITGEQQNLLDRVARVSKLLMFGRRTHVKFPDEAEETFDGKPLWGRQNRLSNAHQDELWNDLQFQTDPEVDYGSLTPELAEAFHEVYAAG